MKLIYQYLISFLIVGINTLFLCNKYIEWDWNTTALIRIILPVIFFILFDPVVAFILSVGLLDYIEPKINLNNINYHVRDKILDSWVYILSFLFLFIKQNHNLKRYTSLLSILFIYRLIGNILFIIYKNKKYLAFFPNLYEVVYISLGILSVLNLNNRDKLIIIILLSIIKILTEINHHILNQNLVKYRLFIHSICKGHKDMLKKTGTYPLKKETLNLDAPIFKL